MLRMPVWFSNACCSVGIILMSVRKYAGSDHIANGGKMVCIGLPAVAKCYLKQIAA